MGQPNVMELMLSAEPIPLGVRSVFTAPILEVRRAKPQGWKDSLCKS